MDPIRVTVRRGPLAEAVHRVHAVAVKDGQIVDSAGNPELVTFYRSSSKPIQALPLARERADVADIEVAIACASHRAEPQQLEAARNLLGHAPATEADLELGPRRAAARASSRTTARGSTRASSPSAACASGRSRATGWRPPDAAAAARRGRGTRRAAAGWDPDRDRRCGVLTFGMSLERMASSFSRLREVDGGRRSSQR
jgi:L-asparaginase II